MNMFANTGKVLRFLRQERGMRLEELAVRTNLGKSRISRYETGGSIPAPEALEKLLTALRVSHLQYARLLAFFDRQSKVLGADPSRLEPRLRPR